MARAKRKVRVGLIGCGGNMRRAHTPRLKADGAVDLVAVVDPVDASACELIRDAWGAEVPRYADYRRMLDECELDAVLISTPHDQHYEQVRAALDRGLHVLVEKPLTPSARQNQQLLDLAAKRGRILEVAYQRRFMPQYCFGRELLRACKIGEIRGVIGYVTQGWIRAGGWRKDPVQAGGGMMMDTGSHLVAIALWMTGLRPVEVSAFIDHCDQPVDINAVVSIRFDNGAIGTLNFIGNAGLHDERLAVHGSEGSLVYHQHQWRMQSILLNDQPAKIPARLKDTSPDAAFLSYIRTGGKGYEPPTFTVQVARLTEAAYRSARQRGRPVPVG